MFVHFSTDYVFDGRKGADYVEDDPVNPLNVYGQSKLEGEQAILQVGGNFLVFRTSWVYSMRQGGFVTKVFQWARQQTSLRMVTDQVGSPTWARMLAELTAQTLACARGDISWLAERRGIYHLAGSGSASRFEWAQEILKNDPHPQEQTVQEILPAQSAEFPTPAERPLYSALDCQHFIATFGLIIPPWKKALKLCLDT